MVPEVVRATAFRFFSGAALFGGALSPPVAGLVAHVLSAASTGSTRRSTSAWPWPSPVGTPCAHRLPPHRACAESPAVRLCHHCGHKLQLFSAKVERPAGCPVLPLRPEGLPQLPSPDPGPTTVSGASGRVAGGQGQGELLRVLRVPRGTLLPQPGLGGAQSDEARPAPPSTRSSGRRGSRVVPSAAHEGGGRWGVGDGEGAPASRRAPRRRRRSGAGASCRCACAPRAPYSPAARVPRHRGRAGRGHGEVLSPRPSSPMDGLVVSGVRDWPEGEVIHDRVVYGPAFVQAAGGERERARVRERARPWRLLLSRWSACCPRRCRSGSPTALGLYAVTATLVLRPPREPRWCSRSCWSRMRRRDAGSAIVMLRLALPGLVLLALPGLGRAFGAVFLRETGGSAPFILALGTCGRSARCASVTTGASSRSRESPSGSDWPHPDTVEASPDRTLLSRGLLPHSHRDGLAAALAGIATSGASCPSRPRSIAGVSSTRSPRAARRRARGRPAGALAARHRLRGRGPARRPVGWNSPNEGFAWLHLSCSRSSPGARRHHHGGPSGAAAPTLATAIVRADPGPLRTPLPAGGAARRSAGPVRRRLRGRVLLAAMVLRSGRLAEGEYAPSLLRWLLPPDSLRPEASPTTPTATPSGRRSSPSIGPGLTCSDRKSGTRP